MTLDGSCTLTSDLSSRAIRCFEGGSEKDAIIEHYRDTLTSCRKTEPHNTTRTTALLPSHLN